MSRPFQKIQELADGQWGLITRAQARATGVPRATFARLLERGLIERIAHGVYRKRGAGEVDHLEVRAAWLQLDPARPAWEPLDDPDIAGVPHTTAASLYGDRELPAHIHKFICPR